MHSEDYRRFERWRRSRRRRFLIPVLQGVRARVRATVDRLVEAEIFDACVALGDVLPDRGQLHLAYRDVFTALRSPSVIFADEARISNAIFARPVLDDIAGLRNLDAKAAR